MNIRAAVKEDVLDLAYLINLSGEGIPEYLLQDYLAVGETPLSAVARRLAVAEGNFSYINARICYEGDKLLGMSFAYRLPVPYEMEAIDQYPSVLLPLVELEAVVPGSWYISAIAVLEHCRGQGAAKKLLNDAEIQGMEKGCDSLSIIVASENIIAHRLCARAGYQEVSSKPVIAYPGCLHGGRWVLMSKLIKPQLALA